jgi:putative transposase
MDDEYTLNALRYIERNPVRANCTRFPWTYRWSSAAAHIGGVDTARTLDMPAWNTLCANVNWKETLRARDDEETLHALRVNTHTGRPLATDSFLSKLERTLGRRLRPLPVGRPKNQPDQQR